MALAATVQWDVRTTGLDSNGGGFDPTSGTPGTDYSLQDAAQVAFTDLVIDGTTNTKCTSAGHAFTSASVGNIINVTSGTGFTVQRVQIMSVAAAVATCDKSLGTLSSTGGHGNLGGSMLTIAATLLLAVGNNTIHIKSGTYTFTTEQTLPAIVLTMRGYGTTHNDGGTRPIWQTSTSTINLCRQTSGGQAWIDNIVFNYAGGGTSTHVGLYGSAGATNDLVLTNCKVSNWVIAVYGPSGSTFSRFFAVNCEFTGANDGTYGALFGLGPFYCFNCYFHGNVYDFKSSGSSGNVAFFSGCVFYNSTNAAMREDGSHMALILSHCVIYGAGVNGIDLPGSCPMLSLDNNVFYGITGGSHNGINTGAAQFCGLNWNNAFGANNANYVGIKAGLGEITLTADPFTAAASADFTLNSAAGGGALLKNAGFPSSTPVGNDYEDVGALRHQDPSGSVLVLTQHLTRFFQQEEV